MKRIEKESISRLYEKLRRSLGSTICAALDDPSVVEIMVNEDGEIWTDKLSCGMSVTGKQITSASLVDALGTIAALLDTEINKDKPILEGELPIDNGSRVEGVLPPVTSNPILVIRKKSGAIFPLSDYVNKKKLSKLQHDFLTESLERKKNILICGGTGSGKTTFCNALLMKLSEIAPNDRVIIMEDTTELQCGMRNKAQLHTFGQIATLNKLLRTTMRLRPDRIIVGEVRGGEALDLLKSWNTGHPGGLATVHANSAPAALIRLEQLISESSLSPMKELIAEAVNVVVFLRRHARIGHKVEEIIEVTGIENGKYLWNKEWSVSNGKEQGD